MANYDFSSLNDKEFESLSTDVLSCYFGKHVERFKTGIDGGVDGRFFSSHNGEVIIQCKHWLKSGLPALLRSIEKTEADKVREINPERYIFVTSLELSRANKIKIKNIFAPYILNEEDVFGNEDINDLLSEYPQIEEKHYKLWITSTNVLKTILNAAIVGRSRYKLGEIIEESSCYVVTESHRQAMEKLENIHAIIITGMPGVGKTMLAEQLCQFYTAKDYELCFIENSLNEAEEYYDENRKQIFYFDDFLGRNFLLALNHHQDSHVVNFIRRVMRDSKKRFILTTRSNVLNQGKRLSDLFKISSIDRNEYELSIDSLTKYDKAKILYNHIWFYQLEDGYIDEIYKDKRYHEIINHKNFNPRLISFITDSHRLDGVGFENYWNYVERTLDNPKDVWKNVFDVQVDKISMHTVIAVSIHGKEISESNLKKFYDRLISSQLNSSDIKTFDTAMRLLVGAMLNRTVFSRDDVRYNLFSPSIADYVISNHMDNIDYLDQLLSCLRTSEAVDNISSLFKSGILDLDFCKDLVEKQLDRISKEEIHCDLSKYVLAVLALASEITYPKGGILEYLKRLSEGILNENISGINNRILVLINWVMKLGLVKEDEFRLNSILKKWVSNEECDYDYDYDEYAYLSKIISRIEPDGGDITIKFKQKFIEFMSDIITEDVIESGILTDSYDDESYSYATVIDFVDSKTSEMSIKFEDSEIDEISDCCNADDVIEANVNAVRNEDQQYMEWKDGGYGGPSNSASIDDLFDRG